jgi:hypothetical protein
MRRWVDYAAAVAAEFRNVSKDDSPGSRTSAYLWDSGFQWVSGSNPVRPGTRSATSASWPPPAAYSARLLSQTSPC